MPIGWHETPHPGRSPEDCSHPAPSIPLEVESHLPVQLATGDLVPWGRVCGRQQMWMKRNRYLHLLACLCYQGAAPAAGSWR